ncbi:Nuclear actin-protein involved in chromatin remodeling [Blastocladiella emersonii ATCC 22665]|nr:Nuclear actin-protein involved in chromatin remodeling [Blastocladiella emersonii ATCC 22665]
MAAVECPCLVLEPPQKLTELVPPNEWQSKIAAWSLPVSGWASPTPSNPERSGTALEAEMAKLRALEKELEELKQQERVRLNVERVRVPEALFHPSLVGVDEAGLQDLVLSAVQAVRRRCDNDNSRTSPITAATVVCSGGGATIPGLADRLGLELTRELPQAFSLDVRRAADPVVDAWRGAATAPVAYVSRAEYFEHGAGWFRDHRFGNPAEW